MRRLCLLALLILVTLPAAAAPRATSPRQCEWYWDIAGTTRAMAMEGIPLETARRAIWRMFEPSKPEHIELGNLVINVAHAKPWRDDEPAGEFASELRTTCLAEQGNLDSVLGEGV